MSNHYVWITSPFVKDHQSQHDASHSTQSQISIICQCSSSAVLHHSLCTCFYCTISLSLFLSSPLQHPFFLFFLFSSQSAPSHSLPPTSGTLFIFVFALEERHLKIQLRFFHLCVCVKSQNLKSFRFVHLLTKNTKGRRKWLFRKL